MNTTTPTPPNAYSAAFLMALRFTMADDIEGGYVNDETDRGGETNGGISAAQYPELDIATLTHSAKIAIYHRDFWMATRCDEWPVALALPLFDTAVLMGADDAVPYMQASLGVLDDGIIGPKTLAAAWAADQKTTAANFFSFRARHHLQDCQANPEQIRFARGWLLRTYMLQGFLYQECLL